MCQAKPPLTRLAASRSRLAWGAALTTLLGLFLGLGGFDGMALCLTLSSFLSVFSYTSWNLPGSNFVALLSRM